MKLLSEYLSCKPKVPSIQEVDGKTVCYLFQQIIRSDYGLRGEREIMPLQCESGILIIHVENPLYTNELWIRKESLLERLNTLLEGSGEITDIKLSSRRL